MNRWSKIRNNYCDKDESKCKRRRYMKEENFANIQTELIDESIEVIEGAFIGVVIGLAIFVVSTICILI